MRSRTTMAIATTTLFSFLLAASFLFETAKAQTQDRSTYVAAYGSTLGAGLALGYDISSSLSARATVNYFTFGMDESTSDNQYSADLNLLSLGLLGDWHPFQSGFRVTAGAVLNGNGLSLDTRTPTLDLGSGSYQGNIKAEADFDTLSPYLGIGWTSGRAAAQEFSFFVDAGVIFQGSPNLTASGQVEEQGGSSCSFSVSDSGRASVQSGCGIQTLQADLQSEHSRLEEELERLGLYPVLMLGVVYRF